jgi:hypothetical protein
MSKGLLRVSQVRRLGKWERVPDRSGEFEARRLGSVQRLPLLLGTAAAAQSRLFVGGIYVSGVSAVLWMVAQEAPTAAYVVLGLLIVPGVCAGLGRPVLARPRWLLKMCPAIRRQSR